MAQSKPVRGWMGADATVAGAHLELREEGYSHQPLTELEHNALNAKMTLLACQNPDTPSLYDHLSTMLTEVLDRKPDNAADDLERQSSFLKISRLRTQVGFKRKPDAGQHPGIVYREWKLFRQVMGRPAPSVQPERGDADDSGSRDDELQCLPNLMRQAHLFSLAGAGLPAHFYVRLSLALRQLAHAWPFVSLRLWGVVHGLNADYTVAEGELRDGEYETDIGEEDDDEDQAEEKVVWTRRHLIHRPAGYENFHCSEAE